MKKQRLIYSLCCPFTNEVHYIGKSTQGMIRPLKHLSESHSEKVKQWVENLKELGHTPIVKILEYVTIEEDLDGRERYWIQRELNKNSLLLNSCLISPTLVTHNLDVLLGNGEGMDMMKIGTFIKEKRKTFKLTQEEFANKAGVALTVVRKVEQGKSNFNINGLLQMLNMFGSTIDVIKIKK
jgi:DNA-binding XRE family transcriptional regulator